MASKRLTKKDRELFVDAVMLDVPLPDDKTCSEEFTKLLHPYMPSLVLELIATEGGRAWMDERSINVEADWNSCTNYRHRSTVYLRYFWYEWGTGNWPKEANEYKERLQDVLTNHGKLRQKIEGVAAACTTVAKLKEALPDLAKYAPDDIITATKNVPVLANLMADVVALGWPGGKIVNAQVVQEVS